MSDKEKTQGKIEDSSSSIHEVISRQLNLNMVCGIGWVASFVGWIINISIGANIGMWACLIIMWVTLIGWHLSD